MITVLLIGISFMARILNAQEQGDLSRARDMLTKMDACLRITGDKAALQTVSQQTVDTIQLNLLRARVALGNIMVELGDTTAVILNPPPQIDRPSP